MTRPPLRASIGATLSFVLAGMIAAAPVQASAPAAGLAPFETIDRIIYLRGSINGSRPLWLLISSGTPTSAVDRAVAEELGLGDGSAGGRVALGGTELPLERLLVADLSAAEDQLGHEVDAVIGYELFDRFVVEIDYYGQILRLHEPAGFVPDERFTSLPLHIENRRAFLSAGVELQGLPPIRRDYRLDTGVGGALVDDSVTASTSPRLEIRGESGGQPLAIILTRTRSVQLGPFRFAGANGISGDYAIGGELLRRFTTVIDYGRGRLNILPNRHFNDRFCFEMLGVELSNIRGDGGMRIDAIYRDSTAEQVGLRIGDVLTAIDGRPTSEIPLGQVRMMFGQQNSYRLTVLRDGSSRDIPVTLRPAL